MGEPGAGGAIACIEIPAEIPGTPGFAGKKKAAQKAAFFLREAGVAYQKLGLSLCAL